MKKMNQIAALSAFLLLSNCEIATRSHRNTEDSSLINGVSDNVQLRPLNS
jgi:hypothetical protein